ncbi:MAG: hypothetical protein JO345_26455 [Streptosporangiaceae bacterium]|nr:hypothetical protein [Streptosporangiaceae bacterium]
MQSVRAWASRNGASYLLIADEEFLSRPPSWIREKSRPWINPLTDLARLEFAGDLLEQYEFAVWADSDVLILDQDRLALPRPEDAAFPRELWLDYDTASGALLKVSSISNYLCAFRRGGSFLSRYREDALDVLRRSAEPLTHDIIGTSFLTSRYNEGDIEILSNLANFSPMVTQALLTDNTGIIAEYDKALDEEIYGVNLCMSFLRRNFEIRIPHGDVLRLVQNLSELSGGTRVTQISRHINATSLPSRSG